MPNPDSTERKSFGEVIHSISLNRMSRRDALKLATGALGSLAAIKTIVNEIPKDKNRPFGEVIGQDGHTYVPIYEVHDYGISPQTIPTDLNGLYRETSQMHWNYIANSGIASFAPYFFYSPILVENQDLIPQPIIKRLAEHNIPVILGDLYGIESKDGFLPVMIGEGILGAASIGRLAVQKRNERKDTKKNESEGRQHHDTAKQKALTLGMVAGAVYFGSEILEGLPYLGFTVDNPTVKRVIARLSAAHQFSHPEIPHLLLRDAFMALMMMTAANGLAEFKKSETGKKEKQKIGFWTHADHSGIEDFLRLGQDACRLVIETYFNNIPELMEGYIYQATRARIDNIKSPDDRLRYFSSK